MRINGVTLCLVGISLAFTACEKIAQSETLQSPDTGIATLDDLPNCTENRAGEIEKVESKKTFYICDNGKWEPLKIIKSSANPPLSSTEVSSSSAATTPSSASEVVTTPYPNVNVSAISSIDCSRAMYCPQDCRHTSNTKTCGKVYTGLDDGTDTQGCLWSYTDSENGGTSTFYWPEGLDSYGSFETRSRDNLGYLKGTAKFGGGFDYPFARFGFWIKGENKPADVTAWSGICLVYSATQDFYLVIRFDGDDKATASDLRPHSGKDSFENCKIYC